MSAGPHPPWNETRDGSSRRGSSSSPVVVDGRKRDIIVFLLERLEDALMERSQTNGRSQRESVSLLPGPWWHSPAFRELERCLDRMRNQARQQAVTYAPGKSCSLGCARWHVIAWHVTAERRTVLKWRPRLDDKGRERRGKNGRVLGERKPAVEVQRHRDAREDKAEAGVAWLVGEFRKWAAADIVSEHWEDRIAA